MKKNTLYRVVLGLCLFSFGVAFAAKPVFLITPTQKAPAVLYAGETATAVYRITNNTPYPLNGNGVVDLPRGVQHIGGSCSTPLFNLPAGASCTMNLRLSANELRANVAGGPVVCNTPRNRIYCSKPSRGNELNVVKSNNPPPVTDATLSLNPLSVTIPAGDTSTAITLKNTSNSIAASSLNLTPSANLSLVNNTCGSNLAHQATCQFEVTSSVVSTGNTVTIQASNSNTVVLDVTVTAVPQATINASPSTLTMTTTAPGNEAIITVMNNLSSPADAVDITADLSATGGVLSANYTNCW